jgi:hypothetical protein
MGEILKKKHFTRTKTTLTTHQCCSNILQEETFYTWIMTTQEQTFYKNKQDFTRTNILQEQTFYTWTMTTQESN